MSFNVWVTFVKSAVLLNQERNHKPRLMLQPKAPLSKTIISIDYDFSHKIYLFENKDIILCLNLCLATFYFYIKMKNRSCKVRGVDGRGIVSFFKNVKTFAEEGILETSIHLKLL